MGKEIPPIGFDLRCPEATVDLVRATATVHRALESFLRDPITAVSDATGDAVLKNVHGDRGRASETRLHVAEQR